ncbi:MAG: class I tRNA ligase family protein [bacterium]|nr:class I tRNA ligase family protein [bacterium]
MNFTRAAKAIGAFVIDDVSNWYVRLSRRRFWQGETTPDKRAAFATLFEVLDGAARLLAPMIPFTAEEIYRALHGGGERSVHLADYPACDASRVDAPLEAVMAAAQAAVGVGRSLRQDAQIRTRQPLGRLLLHADDGRAAALLGDPDLRGILAEELNIKEIAALDDPLRVARLTAKADFRALGPRFGKRAPAAGRAIAAMTPQQALALRRTGSVALDIEGVTESITFDEARVAEEGLAPFVAGSADGMTVALDTTLDEALRDEGLAREVINRVQNLRKKSGFAVADRIRLAVAGEGDARRALDRFGERIAGETLAQLVAASPDLPHTDSFEVDGVAIEVAIARLANI